MFTVLSYELLVENADAFVQALSDGALPSEDDDNEESQVGMSPNSLPPRSRQLCASAENEIQLVDGSALHLGFQVIQLQAIGSILLLGTMSICHPHEGAQAGHGITVGLGHSVMMDLMNRLPNGPSYCLL